MSKRKILSALKHKGAEASEVIYEWSPTPGESVPCWSVTLTTESADRFGELEFNQFDRLQDVLDWVEELQPYADTEARVA